MKLTRLALPLLPLLPLGPLVGACAVAAPVHEAPTATKSISGTVVDEHGQPARARVAVVRGSGSFSMGTSDDGRFVFEELDSGTYVVTATTSDAQIAVLGDVHAEGSGVSLPALSAGSTLWVELRGRPSARLAIFQGELRIHDFTLREDKRIPVVVPPGELSVLLYGRDLEDERRITLGAGEAEELAFAHPPARQ